MLRFTSLQLCADSNKIAIWPHIQNAESILYKHQLIATETNSAKTGMRLHKLILPKAHKCGILQALSHPY